MVKVYLSQKDIPFTEYNVSTNREGLKALLALGCRTTPVTVIGDTKIIGYSPPRLDEALRGAGLLA
jgi:glutaredoxin-like protein NrdH